MDNTINYIIDIYDDMKKIPFLNYFFSKTSNQPESIVYEVSNPTIQTLDNDSPNSDHDNRLSYIISMDSQENDVFTPSSGESYNEPVFKKELSDKEVLKLHIEGKIYDPHIKSKVNQQPIPKKTYVKTYNDIYIKERIGNQPKVKSFPEKNKQVNRLDIPILEDTTTPLNYRNTITFPANIKVKIPPPPPQFQNDTPPSPPILYSETNLDEELQQIELEREKNALLNRIQRKYSNLKLFTNYIEITDNISRELMNEEIDELNYMIDFPQESKSNFDKIYYLGDSIQRNIYKGVHDKDKFYITCINDHILYRYRVIEQIGKGCYGKVLRCYDYKYKTECALKIIKSDKRFYHSYEKEVKYLIRLRKMYTKSQEEGKNFGPLFTNIVKYFDWRLHGVIVFNLYNSDLYHARLGRLSGLPLKRIMSQMIDGLQFLKYSKILHLDLKPENIFLVDSTSYNIKIGDFGLAKDSNTIKKDFNIQTCWYRCPEVVLNNQYSYEADLWSIGLIILELIIDKPIFKVKCDSELYFMMDLIVGQKPNYMFNKNPNFSITNLGISLDKRRRLEQYIITIEESMKLYIEDDLKPLIFGILKWDPSFRISLESCKVIIDNYLCNKK